MITFIIGFKYAKLLLRPSLCPGYSLVRRFQHLQTL